MSLPSVSVVMPVLNEERHLAASVAGVLAQPYDGDLEVLLCVGPSQDDTERIADELAQSDGRIRVVANPSGTTPDALNIGIAQAHGDVIVRVDAHGELADGYIARAVELLSETGAANVGGLMDAQGETPFEQAVAACYNSPIGLGGGGFHLKDTPAGPAETVFLGVFRKAALADVGGFDPTLLRAQDWELNHRLRQAGYLVWFSPELRVTYRPRSTFQALARQFFRTGQWRREVIRRDPSTTRIRYLVPPVAVVGVGLGAAAGIVGLITRRRWLQAGFIAPAAYSAFIVAAAVGLPGLSRQARLRVPGVLATMHGAWGVGFLCGLGPEEQAAPPEATRAKSQSQAVVSPVAGEGTRRD